MTCSFDNVKYNDEKDGISFSLTSVGESSEDGEKFKVSIRIPMKVGWIERMKFAVVKGKEKRAFQMKHLKNEDGFVFFECQVFLETCAVYHYYFSFEANRVFRYFKKENLSNDTSITLRECWKMSVNFKVPEWAKGKIMYHIFVDRYRRGSKEPLMPIGNRTIHSSWEEQPVLGEDANGNWNVDFYGGDLKGIQDTLNYLKRLGVSILYLSPIMRSQSNHRYDTADYEEVDPYAGTNEALKELCDAAHNKNMYVILDAVFNHTGNDSKYFNQYGTYDTCGAYQSEESPYYSFYKTRWECGKKQFSYWWGMKNLPECDGNSSKWKDYILGKGGVIDKWFELGIDGLRLDVADELTDEFIEGIQRAAVRNKSYAFVIGEVWKNPMRMNRGYLESGKGMHSVMNYQLIDALIRYIKYCDIERLKSVIQDILTEYPDETILSLMNFTSTHDISRAVEVFGCADFNKHGEWAWNLKTDDLKWISDHHLSKEQYKYGRKVFKAYATALTFLPGTLSIFYGDESGVTGIGNLANRRSYPWGHTDKKLVRFFRQMGKIRRSQSFLENANFKVIGIDEKKFVFERYSESERIIVIISRTHKAIAWDIPSEYQNAELIYGDKVNAEFDSSKLFRENNCVKLCGCGNCTIEPYGTVALKM